MGLSGWLATTLSASSRVVLLLLVGQWGVTEEREESLPQYTAPFLFLSVCLSARSPLDSGSLAIPRRRHSLWFSRFPSPSLSAAECRPSGASTSSCPLPRPPVLPGAASRYSRFAAPESALHRRRINTGRHPNSLEVNASFPRAPTTSTSYLLYPTIFFQKPDEGSRVGRRLPLLTRTPSLRLYHQKRRDETSRLGRVLTNAESIKSNLS